MKQVKGSKVTLQRGSETKIRAKNHLKVLPKRPQELSDAAGFRPRRKDDAGFETKRGRSGAMQDLGRNGTGFKTKRRSQDELDLEVDWRTIQAMSDHADAPGPRPEGGHHRGWEWSKRGASGRRGCPGS